jgi:hypothetical protein
MTHLSEASMDRRPRTRRMCNLCPADRYGACAGQRHHGPVSCRRRASDSDMVHYSWLGNTVGSWVTNVKSILSTLTCLVCTVGRAAPVVQSGCWWKQVTYFNRKPRGAPRLDLSPGHHRRAGGVRLRFTVSSSRQHGIVVKATASQWWSSPSAITNRD